MEAAAEAAAVAELCRDGKSNRCNFHPNHLVIGICAFCLNERLLILEQQQLQRTNTRRRRRRTPHIHLPNIFALTSFLKQRKPQDQSCSFTHSSSSSPEESFISIKFEENGVASWEKSTTLAPNNNTKLSLDQYSDVQWNQKDLKRKDDVEGGGAVRAVVVVEPRGGGGSSSLRWRKRIGHLFHVMRWKKSSSSSSSAAMGNVGTKLEVEGVKVRRHGWMRTLTKNTNKAGLMPTESRNRCS